MERLSTGNVRLDQVLGGGLVLNAITLVVGAPGTGKTILAEQCLFANATRERPGLYLSTVSEPFDKLLRYGQSLDFFDIAKLGQAVFYDDLGVTVHKDGLAGVLDRIDCLMKQHAPGIVVIDSFKALRTFAANDAEFRRFLHDLAGRLSVLAVSSLWVGEYEPSEATNSPEFAVADGVIGLEMRRSAERSIRYLSVRKLRGSDFLSGDHVYRITAGGLVVFPRLADLRESGAYETISDRVSTGIAALDDALEEGYWSGSTTLIAGPSGAGKTIMGLHFVFAGAAHDEPGLYVTLQENRTQIARVIGRFGWSIDDPNVMIMDRSPVDLYVDELVYELLERMSEMGTRRLVIDSLNDLIIATPDPMRLREFLYSLVQRCARQGVSLMFTYETMELFRITRLSELGMSHVADNVVLLQHFQDGSDMKRALTVLKSRGSVSSTVIREFKISVDGITLGEPIDLGAFGR
ncbi:MAG TPA: ATPase domain-containing protein [Ilumatobacteraceae bacterium]|nr:ATPase domain-containing protein [Ilumatobacteraceae bacterium]